MALHVIISIMLSSSGSQQRLVVTTKRYSGKPHIFHADELIKLSKDKKYIIKRLLVSLINFHALLLSGSDITENVLQAGTVNKFVL